jgi:methyl-accepting chemotaxis protein
MNNQEYILPQDLVILSTSDLQGNIVDYNEGFRQASGYRDDELKGKPHNLLRHPDMPKEAFQDFWHTLSQGRPWFGIVKNKRKNGDYYWVAANVSPITHNGVTTGYLSVRYPASPEQISVASRLYADVKAGLAKFPWTVTSASNKINFLIGAFSIVAALVPSVLILSGMTLSVALTLGFGLFSAIATAFLVYVSLTLSRPNAEQLLGIEHVCNGAFKKPVNGRDDWTAALNHLRTQIGAAAARDYDAMQSAAMLTQAMNATSTNLMVADKDFTVVSINASLAEMFRRNEVKLKALIPGFSASNIIGNSMDIFHHHPQHKRQMVEALTGAWTGEMKVGGLILKLTVVPVMSAGQKIGYVVEWLDRTEEAMVVADIETVAQNMRLGVFDKRVDAQATGALDVIKTDINSATGSIANIIHSIVEVVEAQAMGDLTKELPSGVYHGQFHDLKNAMSYSLQRIRDAVAKAINAATIVNEASGQVSHGASDLSARVQEQATALEQTSATMTEMATAVHANTANARKVADLAKDVQHQSVEGASVMQQTIGAIQQIRESSHKIADIVSLIDGIAFQTNLLALNAAVEAARAGEHGRGFAVVASEVRALAQKSAAAAKDIKVLIDDSVARVENGTRLAEKSGDMLGGITHSVEQVASMIGEIANASAEQSEGISQVHQAIAKIDSVTQQNAALVEETTVAAETLSVEADVLNKTMSFFNTGVESNPATSAVQSERRALSNKPTARPAALALQRNSDDWQSF